ncbi:tyrosine--tRNA ligase [Candidatus Uhrbacteria bacterium]|nr:tyrosine--tRNA ligase [Candidatus Uhrbacteria bacterium]
MPKVSTDTKQIDWLLNHGVENVYPSKDAVRARLRKGEKLRVYVGIDPTGPTLHLGHALQLQKLAEMQALGHEVIMLIGDFTAMIGDPTDKSSVRKQLSREEVLANCKLYKEQASHIISFTGPNAAELKFNSDWLAKMSFAEVVELASHFTVQQMVERDMFEKRITEGKPVHLHEFLYPLMQGYDSVAMDVDAEIGGNDQTFNMLAGRDLQKGLKNKDKIVIALKLLADPSGKKMGKTEGNIIAFTDSPEDAYGKVMSWSDPMIIPGFEICTQAPASEVHDIKTAIASGENPMVFKHQLAKRIVAWMFGEDAAESAAAQFSSVHQKGEKPEEIPEVRLKKSEILLVDALVESGLCESKSEARRQIEQGGVKVNDKVMKDVKTALELDEEPVLIQKGKRHFVRIRK